MTLIERIRCREYGSEDIDLCDELHEAADELESLRAQLKEAQAEIERLKYEAEMREAGKRSNIRQAMELAASQANEVQLREALETAAVTFTEYGDVHAAKNPPDLIKAEFNRDRAHLCLNALSLTSDTTALDAMIQKAGEVMRERCENRLPWSYVDSKSAIRALPGVTMDDLK